MIEVFENPSRTQFMKLMHDYYTATDIPKSIRAVRANLYLNDRLLVWGAEFGEHHHVDHEVNGEDGDYFRLFLFFEHIEYWSLLGVEDSDEARKADEACIENCKNSAVLRRIYGPNIVIKPV